MLFCVALMISATLGTNYGRDNYDVQERPSGNGREDSHPYNCSVGQSFLSGYNCLTVYRICSYLGVMFWREGKFVCNFVVLVSGLSFPGARKSDEVVVVVPSAFIKQ